MSLVLAGVVFAPTRLRIPESGTKAAVLVTSALIVMVGVMLPLRWLGSLDGPSDSASQGGGTSSVSTAASTDGRLTVSSLELEPGITGVAYGFGSVWVAGQQQVSRVDVDSGRVVATIPFRGDDYGSITIGSGAVWVTGGGASVSKIDPTRNAVVAKIGLQG